MAVKFMKYFCSSLNSGRTLSTTMMHRNTHNSSQRSDLVQTETVGHVLLIGINRPEKRNCVNQSTAQMLCDAFQTFESDEDLRVAVLYGKGGNLCAGYDLGEVSSVDVAPESVLPSNIEDG